MKSQRTQSVIRFFLLSGLAIFMVSACSSGSFIKKTAEGSQSYRNNEALLKSAREGNTEKVHTLLAEGVDGNGSDEKGRTALIQAASRGHEAVVRLLLKRGAMVNHQDKGGQTALIEAASRGQEAVVNLLLERNANVNLKGHYGYTALTTAAEGGHDSVVRVLLDHGAEVNHQRNDGDTALMLAANDGNDTIVSWLLAKGADVHIQDNSGSTALISAAFSFNRREAVMNLLLERGADVNHQSNDGRTALMVAASGGNQDSGSHEDEVKLLLDRGADPNLKDKYDETALLKAAGANPPQEAVVKLLLDGGAAVKYKTPNGATALIKAAGTGHVEIVKLLLDHRAEVNHQHINGSTALTQAAKNGKEAVVALLLAQGADVDHKDRNNETALIHAADQGHEAVVKQLIAKGADVNHQGRRGSALSKSSGRGREGIIKLLLANGAREKTPPDYTRKEAETSRITKSQNPNLNDQSGNTGQARVQQAPNLRKGNSVKDLAWGMENLESRLITEITSSVGSQTITKKALKVVMVQVKGKFSPPTGVSMLPLSQIQLAGTSTEFRLNSPWTIEPMGLGLAVEDSCNYHFPEIILKGHIKGNLRQGGSLELSRENEGDELMLSIAPETPLCLAFALSTKPQGEMNLHFGTSQGVVPAATASASQAGVKVYTDVKNKFSFSYPPEWGHMSKEKARQKLGPAASKWLTGVVYDPKDWTQNVNIQVVSPVGAHDLTEGGYREFLKYIEREMASQPGFRKISGSVKQLNGMARFQFVHEWVRPDGVRLQQKHFRTGKNGREVVLTFTARADVYEEIDKKIFYLILHTLKVD